MPSKVPVRPSSSVGLIRSLSVAFTPKENTLQRDERIADLPIIEDFESVPIVLSGISGRFPESDNLEEFSENLFNGIDMVTDDGRRWTPGLYGLPLRMGKLRDIEKFDAEYFGIHAKQAERMDPQSRMLLELTHEAILDAGINPATIRGSNTGVFLGVASYEALELWKTDAEKINGYELPGNCHSMFANRISYAFDFNGPSYALDTACSSSMVALEHAVTAIRSGRCNAAIVGGANTCLDPRTGVSFFRLGACSQDGKCKTFDDEANGYVRSEAAVIVYITRADLAKRSYGTILNAKVNTDGYKEEGVTFPSTRMQSLLLKETYEEAGVDPKTVVYMEAHGTGTKAGDPQEVNSIASIFCPGRDKDKPLLIGSVKSNMGHSETVSGLCGIAKIVLAMQKNLIPANLNFKTPNSAIPALLDGSIKVVDKHTPWHGGIVGFSSFGFGGANAHVILEPNLRKPAESLPSNLPLLIPFAGRTKAMVENALKNLTSASRDDEQVALLHSIFKTNIPNYPWRGYATRDESKVEMEVEQVDKYPSRPVWFVFPGMGSHWNGMGRDLMKFEVFKASIARSHQALKSVNFDLLDVLLNSNDTTFDNIVNSLTCITAVQVALVDLLASIGIFPDGMLGHSLGEIACGYSDNCMTAEQAVLAAHARGRSTVETDLPPGSMAAVGLSWEQVKGRCPSNVFPACNNSKDSVTISGSPAAMARFMEELSAEGVFVKQVNSAGYAFHSKYIADAAARHRKYLEEIIPDPKPRSAKWISSSIPREDWSSSLAATCSAQYHVNNMNSPVLFRDALEHVPENAIVIEIAPHSLLQAILKRALPPSCSNVGLTHRSSGDNAAYFLTAVGKLYNLGLNPDISNLYNKISFPVSAKAGLISPLVQWDHSYRWTVPSFEDLIKNSGNTVVEINLGNETDAFYVGHKIDGRTLFPAAGYLYLVWKTFAALQNTTFEKLAVVFENVSIKRATVVNPLNPVEFNINLMHATGEFQLAEGDSVVVTGVIRVPDGAAQQETLQLQETPHTISQSHRQLNQDDVYKRFRLSGYEYFGAFKGIQEAANDGSWSNVLWPGNWVTMIDFCLQSNILTKQKRILYLPTSFQKIVIEPEMLKSHIASESTITICNHVNLNVIKCPGIEIRGVELTTSSRRPLAQAPPQLEEYGFCPYFDNEEGSSTIQKGLRFCAGTVVENTKSLHLVVQEFASSASSSMAHVVAETVMSEPKYRVTSIVTLPSLEEVEELKDMNRGLSEANLGAGFDSVELNPDCHLVVTDREDLLHRLMGSSKGGRLQFFLYHGSKTLVCAPRDSAVVACKKFQGGYVHLMKKFTEAPPISTIIRVNHSKFDWVNDLKAAMIQAAEGTSDGRIIIVNDSESTLAENGILGLYNCLKQEPGGDKLRCFFVNDKNANIDLRFDTPSPCLQELLDLDLRVNVYENGCWGCYRHYPLEVKENGTVAVEYAYANALVKGDLSSLCWIESPMKYLVNDPERPQNICSVYYASLNFRDILLATGKLSVDALPGDLTSRDNVLGMEYSGVDEAGKRVMGILLSGGLATHVPIDPKFVWSVPDDWTLEDAATVPVVYGTVYYALIVRGKLKAGESVLIHSGSGGVGQAAIAVALGMGCTVFTTVGSEEKKRFLQSRFPQLQRSQFGNSRDCSFEQHVMIQTGGRGVDIVLNSLAGDQLQASVRCLARHGRFLEIGKVDMSENSSLGMHAFLKNVAFHGIHLDSVCNDNTEEKAETVRLVQQGIESGVVKPLPRHVFSYEEVEEAFRFMATGKHMGKVVVKVRDAAEHGKGVSKDIIKAIRRTYFHPKKSYVIIGGLGGFGLELANWMIERGAKKLVLVSRSGIVSGYQDFTLRRLRAMGADIIISRRDVSTLEGAQALIQGVQRELGPVGGIFNLALVLQDVSVQHINEADFQATAKSKVDVTLSLDQASRALVPDLEHFVVFSSISCGRGNADQSNYGFANSFAERLCEARKREGLPALAIQWAAIADVGFVSEQFGDVEEIEGVCPQKIKSCLQALDVFLLQSKPTVASMVLASKDGDSSSGKKKAGLSQSLAHILGIKDLALVNPEKTLTELGMDSLMGVEVKQLMEREQGVVHSMTEIRRLTFAKIQQLETPSLRQEQEPTTAKPAKKGQDNRVELQSENETILPAKSNDQVEMTRQVKLWFEELMPKELVVKLNNSKSDKKIFFIHPIEGTVSALRAMAERVNAQVMGLQCTKDVPLNSIEAIAKCYVAAIRKQQRSGPYRLLGYSLGACIAFEMALQLEQMGESVASFIAIDGSPTTVQHRIKSYKERRQITSEEDWENDLLAIFVTHFAFFDYAKLISDLKTTVSLEGKLSLVSNIMREKYPHLNKLQVEEAALTFVKRSTAVEHYSPESKLLNTDVLLLKAEEHEAFAALGVDYGFSEVAQGRIHVVTITGNHQSCVDPPAAEQVAEIVNNN